MVTPLCELAYKYGSDKCPQIHHAYTSFYYALLNSRKQSTKKVLEIGVGTNKDMSKYYLNYITGASLLMWRDFFPNAQIYGMDIVEEAMFFGDRIQTFLGNQGLQEDLDRMLEKTGKDIDIVIDDGSHYYRHQVFTCKYLMSVLKEDVLYIIEDVGSNRTIETLAKSFNCSMITFAGRSEREDRLLIVCGK